MKAFEAIVTKVTETGKSMYVGVRVSKFQSGYEFGWCANPKKDDDTPTYKKGDKIDHFEFLERVKMYNEDKEPMTHENGEPVMAFRFM